jgi:hypothetical protein
MHNDAAYAKLGLGPLWFEIMANIDPILNGESDQEGEREKSFRATTPRLCPYLPHWDLMFGTIRNGLLTQA